MKPTDLNCFQKVVDVIGVDYATHELERVIDGNPPWIRMEKENLDQAFEWGSTPQYEDFWFLVADGQNPYHHDHPKPDLEPNSGDNQLNKAALTLKQALGHMEDRASTYDSPQGERSMGKTVAMFNSLYGLDLSEEQGWAFMCILKLVRTSQGDFREDNYEDLAAYAGLQREAAEIKRLQKRGE